MVPGFGLVLLLACVGFFYKAAEMEGRSRLVWPGLSLLLWLSAAYFLQWGTVACFMTQVALFAGLTVWNTVTDGTPRGTRGRDERLEEEDEEPSDR